MSQLADRFPAAHVGGATAQVVFVAPSGSKLTTAVGRTAVERTVTGLRGVPKVVTVTDPYETRALSADGRYARVQVSYTVPGGDVTTADRKALLSPGGHRPHADRSGLGVLRRHRGWGLRTGPAEVRALLDADSQRAVLQWSSAVTPTGTRGCSPVATPATCPPW
ncbi:MMPL family transporter [Streptomyces turgidiscabies]|uniref:MMPL family transporter n=1 Tax=Streptomyces turgidiscabies TaxID=85558 RepID=UPI00358F1F6C